MEPPRRAESEGREVITTPVELERHRGLNKLKEAGIVEGQPHFISKWQVRGKAFSLIVKKVEELFRAMEKPANPAMAFAMIYEDYFIDGEITLDDIERYEPRAEPKARAEK